MRICNTVEALAASGSITTDDPAVMTIADVQKIAAHLKRMDMSSNTRGHLLGRLNMICKFEGNSAVEYAKVRYPTLFPPKKEVRLRTLEGPDVDRVIRYANGATDYWDLRACVSVLLPLGTGLRPQETRMVRDADFSDDLTELTVSAPKGGDSYGLVRVVPVHPAIIPLVRRYMGEFHASGRSGYLFQGPYGEPVASNTMRMWRRRIVRGTGVEMDHRILRRTWGQMLLDEGVPEECVSVLLGHASTETTARYYARTRERAAIRAVRDVWENERKEESKV